MQLGAMHPPIIMDPPLSIERCILGPVETCDDQVSVLMLVFTPSSGVYRVGSAGAIIVLKGQNRYSGVPIVARRAQILMSRR
jgi:hypothetical protein